MPRLSLRLIGIAFVSFSAALILSGPIRGQLKPQPAKDGKAEEVKFTEAVTLPTNPESKRLIQAAQDYVKKQEWRIAGECLQSLLETPEDSFIEVTVAGTPAARRSLAGQRPGLKRTASLGNFRRMGLNHIRCNMARWRPSGLKEAIEKADPALLAEISQRYFNTKPGQEATDLLGTYQFDRGQHLMASLCFEQLLTGADADSLPAQGVVQSCVGISRAGNTMAADRSFARLSPSSSIANRRKSNAD